MADQINTSHEAIAALLDGVTEGPWKTGQSSWNEEGEVQYTLHGIKRAGYADCMFIAAARDLVPALAAERDALAARLARISASREVWIGRAKAAKAVRDEAVAERDALAARLARISASREVWIGRAKAAQAVRDEAVEILSEPVEKGAQHMTPKPDNLPSPADMDLATLLREMARILDNAGGEAMGAGYSAKLADAARRWAENLPGWKPVTAAQKDARYYVLSGVGWDEPAMLQWIDSDKQWHCEWTDMDGGDDMHWYDFGNGAPMPPAPEGAQ